MAVMPGHEALHLGPKCRAVVGMRQVGQLVVDHIGQHIGRRHDQPPVQRQGAATGQAPPAGGLITNTQPLRHTRKPVSLGIDDLLGIHARQFA